MKNCVLFLLAISLLTSCTAQSNDKHSETVKNENDSLKSDHFEPINPNGESIETRFILPAGYKRAELDSNSFGFYLRNLPLHDHGRMVKLYNGQSKGNQSAHCAVIEQEIDAVDLQQCADAVMRLRAEFLFSQKRYDQIHFNFVSDNKPRYFLDHSRGDKSYSAFRKYLRYIFSYANTSSLKEELKSVQIKDIQPGDIFIQSGDPYGHALIVMDVAENNEGDKIFLLAQSYMPAQETHILINPSELISPWYSVREGEIRTPEWLFNSSNLKRFP